MKILIINPNSDPATTAAIQSVAEQYAEGRFEIICKSAPGGPPFIATYEHQVQTGAGMISLVRQYENEVDAFIVACHADPNLDCMREITGKPVVGIGEASMKIASMLGHCFSVISPVDHSIPNKEALVRRYHLSGMLASVRAPKVADPSKSMAEKLIEAAKLAIEEDCAEVIVLGCAGFAGLDKQIQEQLNVPVPVLDSVVCALIVAEGLVRYRVSTSKARRYNPCF